MKKAWVLSFALSAQRRLCSDWANAQADLSLRWAHSHFVGFVMSRLILFFRLYTHLRDCLEWNITMSCSAEYSSFLTSVFKKRFTPTLCQDIYRVENSKNKNEMTSDGRVIKLNCVLLNISYVFIFVFSHCGFNVT